MKKRLIPLLILSILLAVVLAACVPSEPTLSTYVVDHTSVWTEAQEETLTQACVQAELTYGIPVIVATSPRSGGEALYWGEDILHQLDVSESDTVAVIVLNEAYGFVHFDVYTYGFATARISDEEIDEILYSHYGDALAGSSAISHAVSSVCGLVEEIGKAYQGRTAGPSIWVIIGVSALIALIIVIVIGVKLKRSYSRRRTNVTYPLEHYCTLDLKEREDRYTNSITTYVVISDGGSSGGGSGGSRGGGGGGGGHRGGR